MSPPTGSTRPVGSKPCSRRRIRRPGRVHDIAARDANGNITQLIEANGNAIDYTYDLFNRLASTTTHPASATNLTTTLARDVNGNVITRTTPDGVAISNTYDALDRLATVAGPSLSISYGYDL